MILKKELTNSVEDVKSLMIKLKSRKTAHGRNVMKTTNFDSFDLVNNHVIMKFCLEFFSVPQVLAQVTEQLHPKR